MLECTPVISSTWDSQKSVVMCGWVSADPRANGCGVNASVLSSLARRLSFSMPRRMPASEPGESRSRRRSVWRVLISIGSVSVSSETLNGHDSLVAS